MSTDTEFTPVVPGLIIVKVEYGYKEHAFYFRGDQQFGAKLANFLYDAVNEFNEREQGEASTE